MYKLLPIVHILAKLGILFAALLMLPALISWIFGDGLAMYLTSISMVTMFIAFVVWVLTAKYQRELKPRDGCTLAVMLWLGFALIAAVPMYLAVPEITITDAYFEAMSGLTTTGATVIKDIDALPPSINFWRAMLQWLGGMGIIVLAVAVLPMLGVGGMQLYRAEMNGINKTNKLSPRIAQTAKTMWGIYVFFTFVLWMALHFAGMSWFDALCHAMGSISLGGVTTHSDGLAFFNSPLIESIIMLGIVVGGMNFANHYFAFANRSVAHYWRDSEIKLTLSALFFTILAGTIYLWLIKYYSFWESLRYVAFTTVSIGLATGYSIVDFGAWPLVLSLWIMLLCNFLCNAGSTGGGIKAIRAIVLFKFSLREMTLLLHPSAVYRVKINGNSVPERMALTILAFVFVYCLTIMLFTFIMMITGLDFLTSLTAIVACITTTGTGLGNVGPSYTFGYFSDLQKWLCLFVMLLGRLEIFTLLVLFTPAYWRK